jgi:hypothetical protein
MLTAYCSTRWSDDDVQHPNSAQRPDSVAGVGGLELRNVALQNAGPNSLVFQNIFVPETFRGRRERPMQIAPG